MVRRVAAGAARSARRSGPSPLSNPAIVSVPAGFLGCLLGTLLSKRSDDPHAFDELRARAETGEKPRDAITA